MDTDMKKLFCVLPVVAMIILGAGCSNDFIPDAAIELASSQSNVIILDPDGGTQPIRFTSSSDWSISHSSEASWLVISPIEGKAGMGKIIVEADRNLSGTKRVAVLDICSGNVSLPVTVEQDVFSATFELPVKEDDISCAGGDFSVKVNADIDYDVNISADWITLEDTKAPTLRRHIFKALPNPDPSERTAVISFVYGDESEDFSVTQRPAGTEADDWKYDRFVHRSLAMRFTADWCGYCPYMGAAFESVKSMSDGHVELLSLHGGGSSLDFSGTSSFESRFNIQGYPTGVIDARATIHNLNSTEATAALAQSVVEETLRYYPARTGIEFSSSMDGNEIAVDLTVYAQQAGTYRATVLLLEDNIIGYQNGGGNDYRHDHVARLALTSISGERFTISGTEGVWSKKFTGELLPFWKKDDLRVLVFVEKAYGSENIVQSVKGAVYGDFGDTYVDNCRSAELGEKTVLELE